MIIDATGPQITGLEFLFDAPILAGRAHTIQFLVSEDVTPTLIPDDISVIDRGTGLPVQGIELDYNSNTVSAK